MGNTIPDNCTSCNYCNYCNSCNFCNSCDFCSFCNYCNYCNSCNYCNYCHYCHYCNSCNYCQNLRMTEYNIFCFSRNYGDENSSQQLKYRAFNQVVEESRYFEIKKEVDEILEDFKPSLKESSWKEEWAKVTSDQWRQLLAIPEAKDFKEGFEFIAGIEINVEVEEMTIEEVCKQLGREIKIVKGER